MIETNPIISQLSPQLRARLGQAVICLAQQAAIKETKRALAAKGLKPQYIARHEIITMAKAYLAEHPELIAEVRPIVEQWRMEGFFGKRAARVERNSQHSHKAESPVLQAVALCETHERNGAAR